MILIAGQENKISAQYLEFRIIADKYLIYYNNIVKSLWKTGGSIEYLQIAYMIF